MRTGPRPLSAHLGMAMSYWSFSVAQDNTSIQAFPHDLQKMLLGIRRYQSCTHTFPASPLKEVWRSGEVTVNEIPEYDYSGERPALILIPSLINKSSILDLPGGHSLIRWLAEKKEIKPYLLDWGDVCSDDGQKTIEGIVSERLVPAVSFIGEKEKGSGNDVHALGYCMGGTLLAAAAPRIQNEISSFIFLAAPWDFHAGSQALLDRVKFWAPTVLPSMEEKGRMSVDWLQMLFASLDPSMATKKFARFSDMDEGSDSFRLFLAVEDWINDGVDLPVNVARTCIQNWFLLNEPGKGLWTVGGGAVKPKGIAVPSLVIASEKDRLVEQEMSLSLCESIPESRVLNPACGHIGMIAGRRAVSDVWEPLAEWIYSHS